ncbi:O-antigen translocase [Aquimarina brevivitae]|uniref:PST family polysaccharide transporter n=1 Tax=Aquimarina brevivitae TaxID=323412 RepID=A0A4Q7NY03_9FLAO|nr:O-antigen translocase [Aquimarina brevivitae]RZS91890.1 PST family polysaccharide transporter [Aquimarina brevivitae]
MLLKVGAFNSVAVLIRAVAGILNAKIIAIFLGAEGMALMGNLKNFMNSLQSLSALGLYNGLVKYVAEHEKRSEALSKIMVTSLIIVLLIAFLLAPILYFGANYWNKLVFGGLTEYDLIFEVLAVATPLYALNIVATAIINGYRKYKIYLSINIIVSILSLGVMLFLVVHYKLKGAFFAVLLTPILSFLFTGFILIFKLKIVRFFHWGSFSFQFLKKLGGYSYMALLSAIFVPLLMIAIRNYIITVDGVKQAGYYEAMLRISGNYMAFLTSLITLYLLPKLAVVTKAMDFRRHIFGFYKIIIPIFIGAFILIYLLRHHLVRLLFSKDFLAMLPLFKWFIVGDLLRIFAMVLATQFVAKRMLWYYTVTELGSILSLYILSVYFIADQGFVGASIAHFCNYAMYLILIIFLLRKELFTSKAYYNEGA